MTTSGGRRSPSPAKNHHHRRDRSESRRSSRSYSRSASASRSPSRKSNSNDLRSQRREGMKGKSWDRPPTESEKMAMMEEQRAMNAARASGNADVTTFRLAEEDEGGDVM